MTAYELMIKTNHYLIQGGNLTEAQKESLVRQLLLAKTSPAGAQKFYNSITSRDNTDENRRHLYPLYFIPPYNGGRKYRTVLTQTPKTQILSANMYELEILRLLHLFADDLPEVAGMVADTLRRLKTTCFSCMDDGVGECFDTSLVVLRFLAAAAPGQHAWIESRIENYNRHYAEKKRPRYCLWYFWLCLSELPFDIAKPELDKYKFEMIDFLWHKSLSPGSGQSRTLHPLIFCILRNSLSRYPEYEYIRERKPCEDKKSGRLYFDMAQ